MHKPASVQENENYENPRDLYTQSEPLILPRRPYIVLINKEK